MRVRDMFHAPDFLDETEILLKIAQDKKYVSPVKMAVDDVFVGIEVEVERVFRTNGILPLPSSGNFLWKNVEDGSLRNNGREFVSIPIRGDTIPFALEVLNRTLNKEKLCIGHEFSERTSVHVHVDVRAMTTEQLQSFILTYILLEPLFYNYTGDTRYNNIFCVPLNYSNLNKVLKRLFDDLQKGIAHKAMGGINTWPKYTGFNLKPVTTYGTVEFRHMGGTCDVAELSNWINLILRLHRYAEGQSFEKLKSRILNMNTTSEYMQIVSEIFGNDLYLIREDKLVQHMEDMVVFIKDIFSNVSVSTLFSAELKSNFPEELLDCKFVKHATDAGWWVKVRLPFTRDEYHTFLATSGHNTEYISWLFEFHKRHAIKVRDDDELLLLSHEHMRYYLDEVQKKEKKEVVKKRATPREPRVEAVGGWGGVNPNRDDAIAAMAAAARRGLDPDVAAAALRVDAVPPLRPFGEQPQAEPAPRRRGQVAEIVQDENGNANLIWRDIE